MKKCVCVKECVVRELLQESQAQQEQVSWLKKHEQQRWRW